MIASITKRFWAKVDKREPDECWEWIAGVDAYGYGGINVGGTAKKAHRISWEIHNGSIPGGEHHGTTCVLHHCDNPLCVNPDHLFLGTQKDNMSDMWQKGRGAKGEKAGGSKLTEAQVLEIRENKDNLSARKRARIYGVSRRAVSFIDLKQRWKHI